MKQKTKYQLFQNILVPTVLLALICLLIYVKLNVENVAIPLQCVAFGLIAVFIFLPFDTSLGVFLFLMPFRGFYHPKWFRLAFYMFLAVFTVKFIVALIKREKRLAIVPLSISLIIAGLSLYNYEYAGIGTLLDSLAMLACAYLTFVNFNEIKKSKLVIFFVAGIFCSSAIGLVMGVITKCKPYVYSGLNRFKALSSHTNTLQMLCSVGLASVLSLYLKNKLKLVKFAVLAFFLIGIGLLTRSKAFLIMLVLQVIVFLIAQFFKKQKSFLSFVVDYCFNGHIVLG